MTKRVVAIVMAVLMVLAVFCACSFKKCTICGKSGATKTYLGEPVCRSCYNDLKDFLG